MRWPAARLGARLFATSVLGWTIARSVDLEPEPFCELGWNQEFRRARDALPAELLDGSWAQGCLGSTSAPLTRFEEGVLTVPPDAGLLQSVPPALGYDGRAGRQEEAVWVHDLSGCRFDHPSGKCHDLLRSGGLRFSREPSADPWVLPLNLSSFVVYLRNRVECHVVPSEEPGPGLAAPRPALAPPAEGPDVYVLMLDSVSRANLAANLPSVWSLLEQSHGEESRESHRSFYFNRFHSTQYGGTHQNMFSVWFGGLVVPSSEIQDGLCQVPPAAFDTGGGFYRLEFLARNLTEQCRHILRRFRDAGFETAWSSLFQGYTADIDREDLDYLFPMLNGLFSPDEQHFQESLCLGQAPLGVHMLSYNERLLQRPRRSGRPRFLWSVMNIGHPSQTGTNSTFVAQQVGAFDAPLAEHLRKVMSAERPPIVLLMSDHGLQFPACDNGKPFLSLLLPRSWMRSAPQHLVSALAGNEGEDVTGWDLYRTLVDLAGTLGQAPEGPDPLSREDLGQLSAKGAALCHMPLKGAMRAAAVDMGALTARSLLEVLPPNRTCEALGIRSGACGKAWAHSTVCAPEEGLSEATAALLETGEVPNLSECTQFEGLMKYAVSLLNVRLRSEVGIHSMCLWPLTAGRVELAHFNEDEGTCLIRFALAEGRPPRVFEAHVHNCWGRFAGSRARAESIVQLTRYRKYEDCAPQGLAHICICGEDRAFEEQRRLEADSCWVDGFSPEFCCRGPRGNAECWHGENYTFERCCSFVHR